MKKKEAILFVLNQHGSQPHGRKRNIRGRIREPKVLEKAYLGSSWHPKK